MIASCRPEFWGRALGPQLVDSFAWMVGALVAYYLRFDFQPPSDFLFTALLIGATSAFLANIVGSLFYLYRQRYLTGSLEEVRALTVTILIVTLMVTSALFFLLPLLEAPRSIPLISAPIVLLVAGSWRAGLRFQKRTARHISEEARRAIVYGAGSAAEMLIAQLHAGPESPFEPVALVDDDVNKANLMIRGVPVTGTWSEIAGTVRDFSAEVIIVAIPRANAALLRRVYADSVRLGLTVVVLPSLNEFLASRDTSIDLREVEIEDLIGRQPIQLDPTPVSRLLEGRKVLVTGAGGSIGFELVRQILRFSPAMVVLVDRDESALLSATIGVARGELESRVSTYLCDIRDSDAVTKMFFATLPQVVFHAAALKHVDMLERFPEEAWKTNVVGTHNVLSAASVCGVKHFVNISTDKAANPASILGKSKKAAEQLTAWQAQETSLDFLSVRFGNVLGSRGSLLPILKEQIERGGPVTVTHPDATRFFMSVSEASQLVLMAAATGRGGEVLVLDMGEAVQIRQIAERMIELSGREVEIVYIGLRPGEKLHEVLFSEEEDVIPSLHPKIFRCRAHPKNLAAVEEGWR